LLAGQAGRGRSRGRSRGRGGVARGGRVAAVVPAVQGRLDGLSRGGVTGSLTGGVTGVRVPPGPERLGRVIPLAVRVPGIHIVHGSAPDRDPDRTYGQQQTPAAG